MYWLLSVCIRTVERADTTGSLFAFVPEFYLNVAMNAYSALKNYFSPVNSIDELPGSPPGFSSSTGDRRWVWRCPLTSCLSLQVLRRR